MDPLPRAVEMLERLVAFDTTSARSNLPLIRFVEAELARHGIAARVLDQGGKANLHALIGPAAPGGIALSAHVDCVPVEGQAWRADPFALRREGGRLIGRGSTDMKGFLACILAVLPDLQAAGLRRPFHLCLTHDEETTFEGAARLVPELEGKLKPRAAVVGEPTRMAPVIAHKGYFSRDVIFTGISGHSSRTNETANALMAAAEAVAWLAREHRRFAREGRRAEGFDPAHTSVHAGTFAAGTILNIVPDRAEFTFEVRAVPGDDPREVLARFRRFVEDEVLPAHPGCAWEERPRAEAPPLGLPAAHPLTLLAQRASGRNSAGAVSYGTEAGHYERAGIPTIVCGPGDIAQAHQPEEFIEEDQLAACCAFLRRLAEAEAA